MAHHERFPGRHPLCTCERPFPTFDSSAPGAVVSASNPADCRGGHIAHPVLDAAELAAILARMPRRPPVVSEERPTPPDAPPSDHAGLPEPVQAA